jgi:hypothetical protein
MIIKVTPGHKLSTIVKNLDKFYSIIFIYIDKNPGNIYDKLVRILDRHREPKLNNFSLDFFKDV